MVELFGGQSGRWETRASLPSACPIAAAVAWDGKVHLVAGSAHSSTVLQYDAHTDSWRGGARMGINRVNLALAGLPDALFALVRSGVCEQRLVLLRCGQPHAAHLLLLGWQGDDGAGCSRGGGV